MIMVGPERKDQCHSWSLSWTSMQPARLLQRCHAQSRKGWTPREEAAASRREPCNAMSRKLSASDGQSDTVIRTGRLDSVRQRIAECQA